MVLFQVHGKSLEYKVRCQCCLDSAEMLHDHLAKFEERRAVQLLE